MSLAIFDLDNTLLAGDSDHAWGEFLVQHGIVDAQTYRETNDRFYQAYLSGELDIQRYLAFALQTLAQHPMDQLLRWREVFIDECIKPMVLNAARQLIETHRQQGHYLLIITATNRFVTEPIAQLLGVDDLIATDAEIVAGRFSGEVAGIPSFREGKVVRLEHWLKAQGRQQDVTWFYSDSHNDLPLLEQVAHPIAVDPDPELAQTAQQRGWPVISLR